MSDIKTYYLIRNDLNMSIAKTAVQVGHGTDYVHYYGSCYKHFSGWVENSRKKIVLKIDDLTHLDKIKEKLREDNIHYETIEDNGLTELNGKTITGIVILPLNEEDVPKYIKRLRLF